MCFFSIVSYVPAPAPTKEEWFHCKVVMCRVNILKLRHYPNKIQTSSVINFRNFSETCAMRNLFFAIISPSFIRKPLSIFVLVISFFASCTRNAVYEPDTIKPQIKVIYPSDNPIIPAGFPLCMQVMISDNISLSKVWLQINDGAGFKKEYEIPGRMMSVTEKYTAPPETSGQLVAKFFAIDKGGNSNIEEIRFAVNN